MFYCDSCRQLKEWPVSLSTSWGPCEICHKAKECWDTPSKNLPKPVDHTPRDIYGLSDNDVAIIAEDSHFEDDDERNFCATQPDEDEDDGYPEYVYGALTRGGGVTSWRGTYFKDELDDWIREEQAAGRILCYVERALIDPWEKIWEEAQDDDYS